MGSGQNHEVICLQNSATIPTFLKRMPLILAAPTRPGSKIHAKTGHIDCDINWPIVPNLDLLHIWMRFGHLLQSLRNLQGADADAKCDMRSEVGKAKWLLWHGKQVDCLRRLEYLRRSTGWAGMRNPLGRLIRYLQVCSRYLVNYRQRRAQGLPISSAGAESVVDYVIGQRMKRNGHMRWSRQGANALLQVRCAVLNRQDVCNFKRWYPPRTRISQSAAPVGAS